MTASEFIDNLNKTQNLYMILMIILTAILALALLRFIGNAMSKIIFLAIITGITGTNISLKPMLVPKRLTYAEQSVLQSMDNKKLKEFKEQYTVFMQNGETFIVENVRGNGAIADIVKDIQDKIIQQ